MKKTCDVCLICTPSGQFLQIYTIAIELSGLQECAVKMMDFPVDGRYRSYHLSWLILYEKS